MTSRQPKKDKSGYGSSWQETPFEKIDLPFTLENLRKILAFGSDEHSTFTHQQIADWCFRFWWERNEGTLAEVKNDYLDLAAQIALSVDVDWDLYLANEFKLKELQSMDFSRVRLPEEWFRNWQNELAN
jgi:hypothetical protein